MLLPQSWVLALPTFLSCVSAFYPYQRNPGSSVTKDGNGKRFIPVHHGSAARISEDQVVKADIVRVPKQKRENQFAISRSNPPTFRPNALAIDQDGSDYSYISLVKFGSSAQPMNLLIDTGSANTWVFSSDCKSETCGIHNTFGKEGSTSLKTSTTTWGLTYGTGEVSGMVATDTVAFANFSMSMGFGLASNASDDFNNYPMDGILGLGRKSSDQLGTPTIIDVLATNKLIAANKIGVHLHRAEDNTKDGEIIFGGIDTGKFSGSLTYTKTSNDDAWEIAVEDMLVNDEPGNFTSRTAIIDTGTTFILMPPDDAKAVHALIPGTTASGESFNLPCNANAKLEVRINGQTYGISAKDYVGKPISTGSSTCSSTIIGHQAFGETQWILGDVFLKNVYTVFDFDNKQIGLGMPGTGGTLASSTATSSSATVTSSSRASASASGSGSASRASATDSSPSSSSAPDSNLGGEGGSGSGSGSSNAGVHSVVGYWKVGFSICMAFWFGAGVVLM